MPGSQAGKLVLITGANSGIGRVTALELARLGATVVCTARDRARGQAAVQEIQQQSGNQAVELLLADFSVLQEVRALAEAFLQRHDRLDVLINNAGLMLSERRVTPDGFEETFAVNHLAPFLLTRLLLPVLRHSAPARIINVSSRAHTRAKLRFDDLQSARGYEGFMVYSRTKLANLLFTRELARRLEGTGVTANALHPGVVRTGFAGDGDASGLFAAAIRIARPFMISAERGARTSVYLATASEVSGVSGEYFVKSKVARCSRAARDEISACQLWEISEQLTGCAAGQKPAPD